MEFYQSLTANEEYEHENEVHKPFDLFKFHLMPPRNRFSCLMIPPIPPKSKRDQLS
jgi:hypothetical protein